MSATPPGVLDSIVSAVPDFVYTFDLNGRFLYANQALHHLLEKPFGSMVGLNFHDLNYPEPLASTLQDQIRQVIDTRSLVRGETEFVSAFGSGYYEYIFVPIFDENASVAAVAGTTRDITEHIHRLHRQQATNHSNDLLLAELNAEKEKLRTLFDQAPAFLALVEGPDLVFEFANRGYYKLIGHRDIIGKTVAEALPEVVDQGFIELLRNVYDSGEAYVGNGIRILLEPENDAQLEEHYLDFVYQPVRDLTGQVSGILAHGVDVTEQTRVRQQLAATAEQMRAIFDNDEDDAIILTDADRTILSWNRAAEKICGWSSEEAVGQPADIIFTPEDRKRGGPNEEAAIAAETGKSLDERWHVRKDGSTFWGSGTLSALCNETGELQGFVKVFRDATHRYKHEQRTQELKEELEQRVERRTADLVTKNQELEGFTYSISHDMRAPLRGMIAQARLVVEEDGPFVSDLGRQRLQRLESSALRMARLVDDLLQYARLGRRELHRTSLNLNDLARETARAVQMDYPDCELVLGEMENMVAEGDSQLIGMALFNLFDNACKYSRGEGKSLVDFGWNESAEGRIFFVRDDGIGFDMRYVGKLFQPFERLHREEYAGTGIGLANVRRAIERHGGRVWAEGEPGKGATFYFTLE